MKEPRRKLHSSVILVAAMFLAALAVLFTADYSYAQSLTLSPNRIIFEGRDNKDTVLVSNGSDSVRSYRVALLKRRMLENGKYVDVKDGEEEPGELYANDIVRVSPRAFSLEPNTSQTIRLLVRKPKDLPDGEYRSHLRVQILPETKAPSIAQEGKIGISVKVNYGITIPIIVRKGDLSYSINVDSINLLKDPNTGQAVIETKFSRDGARSSYGDISVVYVDQQQQEHLLKFLPGLSLFYPNKSRIFTIPLEVPEGVRLSGGVIKVIYREQEAEGGAVIAEGSQAL